MKTLITAPFLLMIAAAALPTCTNRMAVWETNSNGPGSDLATEAPIPVTSPEDINNTGTALPAPETLVEEIKGMPEGESYANAPSWFFIQLIDVRTGQPFSVTQFRGKVVLLENMAIWCTTCLRQQRQLAELHAMIEGSEDLVSIGLNIDPNEDDEMLKDYVESNQFDWFYAVAPEELTREISRIYGAQLINPPSAPMLLIDKNEGVHLLPFGLKSAADLKHFIQPFIAESVE